MIPEGITRKHLLQAVESIEGNGYPDRFRSTRFDLLQDGRRYPPKQVIRLAAELAKVPLFGFSGGAETNNFLKSHGFEVVPKEDAEPGASAEETFHELESIRPTDRRRVMDLVEEAGHDINDWADFAANDPSRNPRYCYEWCFSQPGRADVVCIWFENVSEEHGRVQTAVRPTLDAFTGPRKARIQRLRSCLEAAHIKQAPLRVILLTGVQNPRDSDKQTVQFRRLDPVPWHVHAVELGNGAFTMHRGPPATALRDQFDLAIADAVPERRRVTGEIHVRSEAVRREVLIRAGGRCEFCGTQGFVTQVGHLFLETHHVVPLSENGHDRPDNVIALCPNHHREAHHGVHSQSLKKQMLEYLMLVCQRS